MQPLWRPAHRWELCPHLSFGSMRVIFSRVLYGTKFIENARLPHLVTETLINLQCLILALDGRMVSP